MSAISISASYPISGYVITHRVLILLSPLPKVPGSNPIRRWSSPGKSVSSTTHNWIVTTGRKSNNNRNSEFQFPNPSLGLWGVGQGVQDSSTNEPLARYKVLILQKKNEKNNNCSIFPEYDPRSCYRLSDPSLADRFLLFFFTNSVFAIQTWPIY